MWCCAAPCSEEQARRRHQHKVARKRAKQQALDEGIEITLSKGPAGYGLQLDDELCVVGFHGGIAGSAAAPSSSAASASPEPTEPVTPFCAASCSNWANTSRTCCSGTAPVNNGTA